MPSKLYLQRTSTWPKRNPPSGRLGFHNSESENGLPIEALYELKINLQGCRVGTPELTCYLGDIVRPV